MVSMENKRRNKFESYVILLLRKDAGFSSDFFSYRQSHKKPFKYDSTNRNDVFEMKEILDESKIHPVIKMVHHRISNVLLAIFLDMIIIFQQLLKR